MHHYVAGASEEAGFGLGDSLRGACGKSLVAMVARIRDGGTSNYALASPVLCELNRRLGPVLGGADAQSDLNCLES